MDAHRQPVSKATEYSSQNTRTINLLVATFAGLGLPRTLSLPTPSRTPIKDVYQSIIARLPENTGDVIVSTVSNKQLLPTCADPITALLPTQDSDLISLRLSRRLCGGKGGFGSQLRAAGGRMSSRKNRDRENLTGSNRNLDGRRLRTVEEAKRLADYLTIKPEMEKREKEERKKRWQEIVETSERREEEIKSGKTGANQGRLNADYVDAKELAENKTREAILKAMRDHVGSSNRTGSETSGEDAMSDRDDKETTSDSRASSEGGEASTAAGRPGSALFGWDDEESDEDEDEDGDDDDEKVAPEPPNVTASTSSEAPQNEFVPTGLNRSKGKGRLV